MASDDPGNESDEKALTNWKRWLSVRQKQHKKLGASLQRSPAALVMNSAEDVRYLREEKEILERSQKLMIADKFRGHPDFWRTPLLLPERPGLNRCEITLTKLERGLPVEPLERIGYPLGIQIEKDIIGESRPTSKARWKQNEYLAIRKKELCEFDDFSPRIEDLMIQGHALKGRPLPASKADEKTMTPTAAEPQGETEEDIFPIERCNFEECFCNTRCIPKMKVQGMVLQMKPQMCCDKASAYIPHLFPKQRISEIRIHLNSQVHIKDERFLRIENTTNAKIEFSWIFKKNPLTATRAVFFFNKNTDIILPGHIVHFPIVFHSRSPGVFIEKWQLKTSPPLLGKEEIIICLWGKADANDYQELDEMAAVESYLQLRIAQAAGSERVDEMLKRGTCSESSTSRNDNISLLTEKDIFKEINPGFYYHPSVIDDLKAMYIETFGAESEEWDLNLMKFRKKLVKTSADIEEKQNRLEAFNNKVKKLLIAPQIQTLDLNTMKHDLGKGILGHFPCLIEEQNNRLKECFGMKETKRSEAIIGINRDVEDTEAAATQGVGGELLSPEQIMRSAQYEDTLYKTLYQHLAGNIEQLAANIESIKICNIENK